MKTTTIKKIVLFLVRFGPIMMVMPLQYLCEHVCDVTDSDIYQVPLHIFIYGWLLQVVYVDVIEARMNSRVSREEMRKAREEFDKALEEFNQFSRDRDSYLQSKN